MGKGNKKRRNNRNNKKNKYKEVRLPKSTTDETIKDKVEVNVDNVSHELQIEDASRKRVHEDESEPEGSPKKKKKKKPIVIETKDKKGKKSIRQMKKERYLQRQADLEAAEKEQHKDQCLNYISQWKHDKQNWKFMKARQVWLTKNKFSALLVPEESWPILLEYFESVKGNARTTLLDDANKVIKQMDEWTEKQNSIGQKDDNNDEDLSPSDKPDDIKYKRARDIIQCLQ